MRFKYIKQLTILFFLIFSLTGCNNNRSWTWYERVGDNIYFNYEDKDGEKNKTLVKGADVGSFQILNDSYAKDKNNVYHYGKPLPDAHSSSFQLIKLDYAKDQNNVYLRGIKINRADPISFQILDDYWYSKDKRTAYIEGKEIPQTDIRTFTYLSSWYAKDKNVAYVRGQKIEGSDPNSFTVINGADGFFSKDKKAVYIYFDGQKIDHPNFDPVSFMVINKKYLKDKNNVYYYQLALEEQFLNIDADPATFEPFGYDTNSNYAFQYAEYGKDKDNVYYLDKKIKGSDPQTFQVIPRGYAKDKNNIYIKGLPIEGLDIATMHLLTDKYVKDENTVYFRSKEKYIKISGADAATFEVPYNQNARDKNFEYYDGEKIISTDQKTLKTVDSKEKVVSKALKIQFEVPFSDCQEEEYIADGTESSIPDFIPQGRRNQIFCDNHSFWIAAVSRDWRQYEGLLISPFKYPSMQNEINACISSMETNCKYYKTSSKDGEEIVIFVMDVSSIFDGGDAYWLISYIPIKDSPYYEVAKFYMRIGDLPTYNDKNYKETVQEYLNNVVDKKLNEEDLAKVENFERTLLSIKNI